MFESLSDRLSGIFDGLTRRGALSEKDVSAALREVRRALIEADVALEVVRSFTEAVRERAVGASVVKSVTPGQMVVKIVHDELVAVLGEEDAAIDLNAPAPVGIMMVGLQGSGKTTTTGKIAKRMQEKQNKKVLMASLDVRRPAAQEQLRQLGEQTGVETLPIVEGQTPVQIANRAVQAAKLGGFDVCAARYGGPHLHRRAADGRDGGYSRCRQPARNPACGRCADRPGRRQSGTKFRQPRWHLPASYLTRIDGDGRGGAALSMRAVTGKPIKLLGTGEKMDALEDFYPKRIADRILRHG